MTTWDFRTLIETTRAPSSFPEASALLRSIEKAQTLFYFQAKTALAALDRCPSFGDGRASPANVSHVFCMEAFESEDVLTIEANVLGSIEMVRAGYDYFAHLLNGLILPTNMRLKPKEVSAERVFKLVPPGNLADVLLDITRANAYLYMASYSNTVKHRHHVDFSAWINFSTNEAGIGPVSFPDDRHVFGGFPHRTAREVLKDCVDLWNGLVIAGRTLSAALGHEATA